MEQTVSWEADSSSASQETYNFHEIWRLNAVLSTAHLYILWSDSWIKRTFFHSSFKTRY
jgi:hypothetical protein